MIDLVKGWGGKGEATILIHGGKVLVQDAAMINAVLVRSYDFEEQSPSEHQNATVIPVALAMGEMLQLSGKDFLTALIVGTDVGHRISTGFDFDFFHGWDNIGSLHTFASAAIAGRLLGLTPLQLRNAFGLALHLTGGSIQSYWDCDTTYKLNNGFAARSGIFAAQLAKAGLVGTIDALHARYGYYHLYTHGCTHPEAITQDLGKKFVIGRNMYKRYPCGRPNHVPIELGIALANEHDINAADISEVTIAMPRHSLEIYYAKPWTIRDYPVGEPLFSFRYTLASALLRRHMNLYDLQEEAIRDPEIDALISKINLEQIPGDKRMYEVRDCE